MYSLRKRSLPTSSSLSSSSPFVLSREPPNNDDGGRTKVFPEILTDLRKKKYKI